MEIINPSNIHQNVEFMHKTMSELENFRNQVEGKKAREIDRWLQRVEAGEAKVKELDKAQSTYKASFGLKFNIEVVRNIKFLVQCKTEFNTEVLVAVVRQETREKLDSFEENVEVLSRDMGFLKHIKYQVARREGRDMDGWLEKVEGKEREVDEIRKEFQILSREYYDATENGATVIDLKALETLLEKVIENRKSMIFIINEGLEGLHSNPGHPNQIEHKTFSHEDLIKFTSQFAENVGSGGFSNVYKGQLDDGKQVAVKVLTNTVSIGDFMAEMQTMITASHPNLVTLYGFCFDYNMKALVYEFLKNGSLDKILFDNHLNLDWGDLYEISLQTAKGLAYLHSGCGKQIIHRDVKPANVLLDENLSPKITDFGLARLISKDANHYTITKNLGTPGYMAPEFGNPTSDVTKECDVYSFGVMLFEVLGKRCNGEFGSNWFPIQVWEKFKYGQLDQIVEDCGIVEKDQRKATVLTTLALWCVQMTPEIRPSMSDVVLVLQNKMLVTPPPNPFQHQPVQNTRMGLLPQSLISTIHESLPERAEEFVSSSSSPSLKSSSSDHLNNTENSSTSIPRCGKATEILEQYQRKCPPGGEDSVIFYTTTFEKTKKPFKESNDVRSILQSHQIKMIERDVCGDGNYDDELDDLVGGPFIPAVFVKGRYIGGASEVKKLEEEGKLKMLFDAI